MFIEINGQTYNVLSIISCRAIDEVDEETKVTSYNLAYEDENGHILIETYTSNNTRQARIAYLESITFGGGGEGGTTNYNILTNKPAINGTTLVGNLTGEAFGLQDALTAGENITIIDNVISAEGGTGGTDNYNELTNKPTLNNVVIEGAKTNEEYGINIPDISNLATKAEVNTKQDALSEEQLTNISNVENKADTNYVNEELNKKQDALTSAQLTSIDAVPAKANISYVNTELNKKQDILTQAQIDAIANVTNKADKTYVDDELSLKQNNLTETQLNAIDNVENKADKTYVDEELNKKQDTLSVAQLTNIADVPNKQNKLVAGDNIEIDPDTNVISAAGGGTTGDYNALINKPTINNVELDGNKTTEDLGIIIPDISDLATKEEVAGKQDVLTNAQLTNIDAVPNKANTDYVNTELAKKQNSLTEAQLTNINAIPDKADTATVNAQLAGKQDLLSASQIAGIDDIPNKANTIYVNEQLATKQDKLVAGANITINEETNTISASGGSGGATDYTELTSKPQINGVELNGNKTTSDLGIIIPTTTSELTNDSGFVEDISYVHTDNNFTTLEKDKLTNLENYDDTTIKAEVTALQTDKADKSTVYTKIEVDGILTDYALKTELPVNTSDLINDSNFVVDDAYVHTDNNFTTEEKTKLAGLENYDDTTILEALNLKANKTEIPTRTSELLNDSSFVQQNALDTALATKSDKIIIVDKTNAEMVDLVLVDNTQINVTDALLNMTITSATGIGIINFVAGASATITLPEETSWNGNHIPTITEGKFYVMTYAFGTFYIDEGR